MSTLNDVIEAWRAIDAAEQRYRAILRQALDGGVQQAEISRALGRTRESIRQDALSEEERAEIRRRDAERKRNRTKKVTGGQTPKN